MKLYSLLILSLFFSASLQAEESTQVSRIASIQMKSLFSGERFALITLEKASANPDDCEKANGRQFALDIKDQFARHTFYNIGDALFEDDAVSFIIEGCRHGYPRIVKIK